MCYRSKGLHVRKHRDEVGHVLPFHRRRTQGLEDMSGHMGMGMGGCGACIIQANITSVDPV